MQNLLSHESTNNCEAQTLSFFILSISLVQWSTAVRRRHVKLENC